MAITISLLRTGTKGNNVEAQDRNQGRRPDALPRRSVRRSDSAFAIVNGSLDTVEPHQNVGLVAIPIPGWGLMAVCTGTLISPTVFLTAAHCTAS